MDAMLERRVRDFRLDSRLRTACQSTIPKLCDMGDDSVGDALDAAVANCLQVRTRQGGSSACWTELVVNAARLLGPAKTASTLQ
jgi:Golgi apparatus protein 1